MGLSALRAAAARYALVLDDLCRFAETGVLDKMPDVHGAIVAGVGALVVVVVILILSDLNLYAPCG